MITSLARIIKYGFQNFVRNGWLSVATIAVMVLTLTMFIGLAFFDAISKTAIVELQDKIDISVYFKPEAVEEDIADIRSQLEKFPEVKLVEYISRDEALAIFKQEHEGEEIVSQAVDILGSNPLLASLNIKANNPDQYPVIAAYLENENFSVTIKEVTYSKSRGAIDRLARIVDTFQNIGFGMTIVLSLIAVLITFNTIRLAIYSNREELGIMRLVGAANKFINGPYLVNGILYGVVAAIISIVIFIPLTNFMSPYVNALIPKMVLKDYFYGNFLKFLGLQLVAGVLLGAASSAIAIRRYLKL